MYFMLCTMYAVLLVLIINNNLYSMQVFKKNMWGGGVR